MTKTLKTWTIVLIIVAAVFVIFIVSFLIVGLSYGDRISKSSTNYYGDVMRKSKLENNTRVVDIAMLGAHDAFSDCINASSQIDPGESGIVTNSFVNIFAKGLAVRYTKAQKSNASVLLNSGVRYFDVRISYHNGSWYTRHGYINELLGVYLLDIVMFLMDNPKEFIVFDIQDVYVGASSYKALFEYIASIKYAEESGFGKSLLSFLYYEPNTIPLDELTYGDVTDNGKEAGVIILCNAPLPGIDVFYNRDNSIRSVWHNQISDEATLDGIESEYKTLTENKLLDRNKFRVNQAQKTLVMSDIFAVIDGWSLLKLAENFNAVLIDHEDFMDWLKVMPIFMVDYADSAKGDFNDKVNKKIIEYNRNLGELEEV